MCVCRARLPVAGGTDTQGTSHRCATVLVICTDRTSKATISPCYGYTYTTIHAPPACGIASSTNASYAANENYLYDTTTTDRRMIIPRLRSLDSATTGNSGVLCFNNEAAVRGFLAQPGGGILAGGETARARDLPGRLMVTCRPPIIRDIVPRLRWWGPAGPNNSDRETHLHHP